MRLNDKKIQTELLTGIDVEGHVTIRILDPEGRPVHRIEKNNIWTLTGREYLAQLIAYQSTASTTIDGEPGTPFRRDRVLYLGMGSGAFPQTVSVNRLAEPVEFQSNEFLAPLVIPPDFPLSPARTSVRFSRIFSGTQISLAGSGTYVDITEAGLFTSGGSADDYAPGTRETGFGPGGTYAEQQAPVAYVSFEPIPKWYGYALEILWEVRF